MQIEDIRDLGIFIKKVRTKLDLTQSQVAFASKVERSTINRLEKGKVDGIGFKTFLKIVKGLNGKLDLYSRESV